MVSRIRATKALVLAGGYGSRMMVNIHKGTLPMGGKPNILRIIEKLRSSGIQDIYVSAHHNAGDIVGVIMEEGRYRGDTGIHYQIEHEKTNTASSAYGMVFGSYKEDFRHEDFIWVVSCDMGFPRADLVGMREALSAAAAKDNKLMGSLGCLVRPANDFVNRLPWADIGSGQRIIGIADNPPRSIEEAREAHERQSCGNIAEFEAKTGHMGLPYPIFPYLISRDVIKLVRYIKSVDRSDVDIMRHLFKLFPGNLLAHFFEEGVKDGELMREYYDLNRPEDFYRAQWMFMKTTPSFIPADFTYDPVTNSYVAPLNVFPMKVEGNVLPSISYRNSIIGQYADLTAGCDIQDSIIGRRSDIFNAVIKRSIVLPYTRIYGSQERPIVIEDSIVGGTYEGYAMLDARHLKKMDFRRKLVVNENPWDVVEHDLAINDADVRSCEEAFAQMKHD